jgi:hypothetical protein
MSLLLLSLALVASPAAATSNGAPAWGPRSATAIAQRTEVHLGEPFTVTVEVRHDKGEVWTLKPGAKLDPFKLRSVTSAVQEGGDLETTRLSLELALFQLGPHVVPDLELVAALPKSSKAPKASPAPVAAPGAPIDSAAHAFSLPGPHVTGVATKGGGSKEKSDIRGPVPFKVTSFRMLLYVLAALAVLGAAWWAYLYWRNRPRREVAVMTPAVPEDQTALEALSALEAEGLPARGRFKEFHLGLSEILRRYLGERYGILGLDMTSEELYQALARLPSEGLSLNDLSWVCAQGDLAKFAKAAPTVDDCRQALQLVRQLVVRTRRVPVTNLAPQASRAA